jgi:glutamate-1-semialdehyde 2,1-aminomutase
MMSIEPGRVAQGGTYAANSVAVAAAVATLDILEREPIHETINQRGKGLMSGIGEILSDAGIPHCVLGVPSMFGIMLGTEEAPVDFRGYLTGDGELYEQIVMKMAQGGGPLPDADGREPWFLCYSLSDADVADTLERFEGAVKAVTG